MIRRIVLVVLLALSTGCSASPTHADVRLQRHGQPILTADRPWEQDVVQEPSVWREDGRWHMVYTGGWYDRALGYATADSPEGPWTKHGRVLGQGRGGWAGTAAHASVYREAGQIWIYFSPGMRGHRGRQLRVATGPDVRHLHVLDRAALKPRPDVNMMAVANTSVAKDGARYVMMFEGRLREEGRPYVYWRTGVATAPTPAGPFTVLTWTLDTLERGRFGMYGGPDLHRASDGRWVLWYHAAVDGALQTELYRATSADLSHWRVSPRPIVGMYSAFEVDQVADPWRIRHAGHIYLFWDGMDNRLEKGAITYGRRR